VDQWRRLSSASPYCLTNQWIAWWLAPTSEVFSSSDVVGGVSLVWTAMRRVLRLGGTAWLILSDLRESSRVLLGLPWRVVFALQREGWIVRNALIGSPSDVLIRDGRVLLVHNERDEWELPGGRIEPGEAPEQTVAREIAEETGLAVEVAEILDAWMYHIAVAGKDVFIVTYGCTTTSRAAPVSSHEHSRVAEFAEHEVPGLPMPEGYKRSIATWFDRLGASVTAE
jgi:8-oxo-dGTP pyrophosphatase MutT (NUDIX family)